MILRVVTKWKDGSRHEVSGNYDAHTGRGKMAAMKRADGAYWKLREVKNGYQYDAPRQTKSGSGCTTTVTLERGWE